MSSRASRSSSFRTIIGGGLYLAVSTALAQVLGLAGSILLARLLGREDFGAYGVLASTTLMVGALASSSLHVTALKFVAQHQAGAPERAARIYGLCFLSSVVAGAIAALAIVLASDSLAAYVAHPSLAPLFRITGLTIPFAAINGVQTGRLLSLKNIRALALVSIASSATQLAILPIAALLGGLQGLSYGLLGHAVLSCGLHSLALMLVDRAATPSLRVVEFWQERAVLWTFALPHLLSALVSAPAQWWPIMLLSQSSNGLEQVAVFSAAQKWRQLVLFLPGMVSKPSIPLLAESFGTQDYARAAKILALAIGINALAIAPIVGFLLLASDPLIGMYGSEYREDGVATMRIIVCAGLIQAFMVPLGDALTTAGRNWSGLAGGILRSLVLVAAAIALLHAGFGASGVALAHLLSALAMLVIQVLLLAWVFHARKAL